MKERVIDALAVSDACVRKAIGEVVDMPSEEKDIIQKWLDKGVIEYSKKKINFSKEIYFPLMQHDVFKDMTIDLWRRIVIKSLNKHGTGSKLSKASADDYMSKAGYKYSVKPVLLKRSEASAKQKIEETEIMEELL